MDQAIWFQIDNHVYICKDIPNVNDKFLIDIMNSHVLPFGKYGHNLAVCGGINAVNALKPEPYLPELSAQKVREYLNEIETPQFQYKTKNIKTESVVDYSDANMVVYNEETETEEELYFLSPNPIQLPITPHNQIGFSEIVGIDGETVFKGSLQFT